MRKLFLILLIAPALFTGCSKDETDQYAFAGVWDIEQLDCCFYSGGNSDSCSTQNNIGTLRFYDNGAELNNVYYGFSNGLTRLPQFMYLGSIQSGLGWTLDNSDNRRFIFFTNGPYQDFLAVYTVKERKRNYLELVITGADNNGNLTYRETIILRRRKP